MRGSHAFTIVELLVVVTIIVVLLALLTPALEKAIYQADLAVCATQLKAIATEATIYAMDYRRRYPYRGDLLETKVTTNALQPLYKWRPDQLSRGTDHDLREVLRGYIQVNKMLLDPLAGDVDLERTQRDTHVFGSYAMWFGWTYTYRGRPEKGMKKIGDHWAWLDREFNLIAGDHVSFESYAQNSHPDADDVSRLFNLQDQPSHNFDVPTVNFTLSRWVHLNVPRGLVDLNFAYADGGVQRINGVKNNETDNGGSNEGRMTAVSMEADERVWPMDWIVAPRQ